MANIVKDVVRGDLSGPYMIEMLYRWHKKYQVLDGYAITAQASPNNTVKIDAGRTLFDGAPVLRSADGNVTFATCSETLPRIDLLYAKNDGTVGVHQGDNAAILDQQGQNNWRQYIEPYIKAGAPAGAILGCVLVRPRAGGSPVIETADIWSWGPQSGYGVVPYQHSVSINQRGTVIYATDEWGQIIDSGVTGTDDTDVIDAAVAACPTNGSIFFGPGTYTLLANKLFYLSGDGTANPHYYAFGPAMEGKNCHVFGAGIDVTILKLANNQHYTNHHAVLVFNRATGDQAIGFTSFTLANMTLDGNRANQSVITVMDGPGTYLSGSIRKGEKIFNVRAKNSHGHGFYLGNNGGGPVDGALLYGLQIDNCYRSGICTDTARHVSIGNCIISNCSTGIELLGNSTDYTTRRKDNISVSNVSLNNAGLQVWCINGCAITGCTMDITDSPVHSYGLQVHCSINVLVADSTFDANHTSQYCTYIDGGGYINDGEYKNVTFRDCIFRAFQALKVFGNAKISAVDCFFEAFTYVYLNESEQEVRVPGACVYLYEMGETITATVEYTNCEFVADAYDTYIFYLPALSTTICNRCHAPKVGAISIGGGMFARDCSGPGLEGYNSRWRQEASDAYNSTPASANTITMLIDRTGVVGVGWPIKYLCATSGWGYGIITTMAGNLITFAGTPMSGEIYYLAYGNPELVGQADYVINGAYADAANSSLIATDQKSYAFWRGRPARLVQIGHRHHSNDSTSNPNVTALINGNAVGTDNSNTGLQVTTSVSNTTSGINASNNRILNGQSIEIKTSAGGTGNANTLTVFLTFVSED